MRPAPWHHDAAPNRIADRIADRIDLRTAFTPELRSQRGRRRIIKWARQRDVERNLPNGCRHRWAVDNFVCKMAQVRFKPALRPGATSIGAPIVLKKLFLIMTLERID